MAKVVIDRISRHFGGGTAVDDLSLAVEDGEFVVFLGPSGCGKTTTLNMVAGLDTPSEGEIYIGGRPVASVPPDKRDIAMVFQSIALYPHMTVYNNIAFPLRRARVAREEIDRRVRAIAEMLQVTPMLDRRPHQLSGGQRQRVAIGRAAIREPAVFLFDEPLSSLDAKLRTEMRIELKRLHQRLNATFIYVTHDQVEAMTMADRVAVMHAGKLMQFASPREVYRRPANRWVASFVGSPAMTLFDGEMAQEAGRPALRLASGTLLPLSDCHAARIGRGTVTLGIRPEAVQLATDPGAAGIPLRGRVVTLEPVGSDLYIDLCPLAPDGRADESMGLLKLRTDPDTQAEVGEILDTVLPEDRVYLFDAEGARVYPAEAAA